MSIHSSMASGGDSKPPTLRLPGGDFSLVRREIHVSGAPIPLLEVPYTAENLERLAATRGLKERDWPYWLEDWPASYALAEVLAAENPASVRGPVLDLGCGSGFLAAFLRLRFGLRAFNCDFNRDACALAAVNAPGGRVFCADFSRFPSSARFGALLAGEMLYAKENQAPILAFLDRHLLPGGTAWLADPGRSAAEGFRLRASERGWRVDVRRVASRAAGRNVDVYKLDRAGGAG